MHMEGGIERMDDRQRRVVSKRAAACSFQYGTSSVDRFTEPNWPSAKATPAMRSRVLSSRAHSVKSSSA